MRRLTLLIVTTLALAACTEKSAKVFFDGHHFPASAKHVKDDREQFVVSVKKVAQSLDGAREAGRHAGIRYCVETFGLSDIIWQNGPDAEDGKLQLEGGNLVMRGRCVVW